MAIVVKPVDAEIEVVIEEGEDKVSFFITPLDYQTKSVVSGLSTVIRQGQVTEDAFLQVFFNIKYGLKRVEGLESEDGKPYPLEFEDGDKKALSDKCINELLATPVTDGLQFAARSLSEACYPEKILHPVTRQPLPGISVVRNASGPKKK